jgi:hypothetical protein
MKHVSALLFAAALAFASASAAHAFTFESGASGDGANGRNYLDPQDQIAPKAGAPQRFNQGQNDEQKSGFFMNFGSGQPQTFDQKYNSNDTINSLMRR